MKRTGTTLRSRCRELENSARVDPNSPAYAHCFSCTLQAYYYYKSLMGFYLIMRYQNKGRLILANEKRPLQADEALFRPRGKKECFVLEGLCVIIFLFL